MDAKHSLGEPRCLVSRAALLHNVGLIRKAIAPHVKLCAVVKADAYGHGAEIVADTLCNFTASDAEPPIVDALAVADIDEAAALPPSDLPILVLQPVENAYLGAQKSRIEAAVIHGWVLTLASASAADDLARIAQSRARRANVQIMIDTGLNRAGVSVSDFPELLRKVQAHASLRLSSIATHFASADEAGNPFNLEQLNRFIEATKSTGDRAARPQRSAANSASIFFHPQSHLDAVRPGISLYGIDPTCRPSMDRALRPVMRWTAPLIAIRDVPAGSTAGYGQTWTAPRDTRLGLVPIGYADGYPRSLSSKGVMLVGDQPCPVAGRVSMDLTVIDLTAVPAAIIGDEVTILDNNPLSPASVYRMADAAGTIPYEIFCRIGQRVRRVAVDDFEARPARASRDAAASGNA